MKITRIQPFLYLSFSLLIACSSKQEVNNKRLDYTIKKEYRIPLSGDEQYEHTQLQMIDSGTIIALDQQFQRLDILSLSEKKLVKSIPFAKDGPNQIYPTQAIYFHNKDSIFLYSLDASAFQLINLNAEVLDSWILNDNTYPDSISASLKEVGVNSFSPVAITQSDFLYFPFSYDSKRQSLLFNVLPNTNAEGFNDRDLIYSLPPIAIYNIKDRKYKQFMGKWPDSYQREMAPNNPFIHFYWNKALDELLVNFQNDPSIYWAHADDFYTIGSNYFKANHTQFDIKHGVAYTTEEELEALHVDEAYINLIFNPSKNHYYRIAKHVNLSTADAKRLEAPWSIIVFNKQFEVLGEVLMPKAMYNYLHILPTPEGLLISKENPYSSTNKEEEYAFDLIEINL